MKLATRMRILSALAFVLAFTGWGMTAQAQQWPGADPQACAEHSQPYRQLAPRHVPPGLEVAPDCGRRVPDPGRWGGLHGESQADGGALR